MVATLFVGNPGHGVIWGYENAQSPFFGQVWEYRLGGFGAADYRRAVNQLLATFEETTGRSLIPGEHQRAGLKVNTMAGAGLSTPPALTEAVIEALLNRGFTREQIFVLDAREPGLRDAGYLPPLSQRQPERRFAEVPVLTLEDENLISDTWFYESALPREFSSPLSQTLLTEPDPVGTSRISYLAAPLVEEVDFWINLPVLADHPALGLSGALVNATLWNINNRERFLNSAANGPVAVAEIAAIPELRAAWALTLLSLERFQYIGGPGFYALYTSSEPRLLMAIDPVILDALMIAHLNEFRERDGFAPIPEALPFIDYAVGLGLGYGAPVQAEVIPVAP